jgi:phage terminase small subunit
MCDRLEKLNTLTVVDDAVLEQYSLLVAETRQLEAAAAEDPRLLRGIRMNRLAIRQYLSELGLTPASRARVKPLKPTVGGGLRVFNGKLNDE